MTTLKVLLILSVCVALMHAQTISHISVSKLYQLAQQKVNAMGYDVDVEHVVEYMHENPDPQKHAEYAAIHNIPNDVMNLLQKWFKMFLEEEQIVEAEGVTEEPEHHKTHVEQPPEK